jgi:hypothetical protein
MKGKRPGKKKPFIETLDVPDYFRDEDRTVRRERIIDRDNDRYLETVSDYESGKVIRHCDEPLSDHQGHGSAKRTRGTGSGKVGAPVSVWFAFAILAGLLWLLGRWFGW